MTPAGCPAGTTIKVMDLFYNTPARMKFLKKDVQEGNSVAAVVERIALSHPENLISARFAKDKLACIHRETEDCFLPSMLSLERILPKIWWR